MLNKILLQTLIIFSLFTLTYAIKYEDLVATDYVKDYANILTTDQKVELNKKLGDLEKTKNYQVAVAIVPDMGGDYIEHYASKLYEQWGLGKAGSDADSDQGALFLISINDRQMRIEVGYGLEPVLTDGITKNILDNYVRPEFKNENYYSGINVGVDNMITVLGGGEVREVKNESTNKNWLEILIFIFIIGINILGWLFAIMARTKSWWLGGIVTTVIGFPILYYFGFNIINDLIFFVFAVTGFVFDYFISKNYKYWESKVGSGAAGAAHPAWWAGGGWGPGGGSSGGSGFGGFGGGSSGGGGSSSSW